MIGRFLAIAVMLACAAGEARAAAALGEVSSEEILTQDGTAATFEITCKGGASFLCVQSEDRGTPDDPMFASLVGIRPTAIAGATVTMEVDAGGADSICLKRRTLAESMKAYATFAARKDAKLPATYRITAVCTDAAGAAFPTKLKVLQRGFQF